MLKDEEDAGGGREMRRDERHLQLRKEATCTMVMELAEVVPRAREQRGLARGR
jgi:ribosome-binding protein aMBF1 (putative translation factor)